MTSKLIQAGLEARIANALMAKNGAAVGPTELGLGLGLEYTCASSGVMGPLRRLVKAGKVEYLVKGKYRWRYDH
jgi:hypothetical protein